MRRTVTERHRLDPSLRVAIDHVYWLQIGREHKFLRSIACRRETAITAPASLRSVIPI